MKKSIIYPSVALLLLTGCNQENNSSDEKKAQQEAVKQLKVKDYQTLSYKEKVDSTPQKIENKYGAFNYDFVRDNDNEIFMKQFMNKKKTPQKGDFVLAIGAKQDKIYKFSNESMTSKSKEMNVGKDFQSTGIAYNRYHHFIDLFEESKNPSIKGNQYTFQIKDNPKLIQLNSGGMYPLYTDKTAANSKEIKKAIENMKTSVDDKLEKGYVTFTLKNNHIQKVKLHEVFKGFEPHEVTYSFYDFNHKDDVKFNTK